MNVYTCQQGGSHRLGDPARPSQPSLPGTEGSTQYDPVKGSWHLGDVSQGGC